MGMEINELNIQLEMAVMHDGCVHTAMELPNISSREYELKQIRELLDAGKTQKGNLQQTLHFPQYFKPSDRAAEKIMLFHCLFHVWMV